MSGRLVVIAGRVQGVGWRDWMVREAARLGVAGWVRNRRRDGTVEALLGGPEDAVEELLRACRRGPRGADVVSITEHLADPPDEPGFHRRPSV